MEAMKADMITLVQQLKDSEERCNELSRPGLNGRPQESVLEKRLKSKDDKLQKYREIIVKLKEEFITSEEAYAKKLSAMKDGKSLAPTSGPTVGASELKELKDQIAALRDGLKQAKRDLEEAIKKRESISKAKKSAEDEVDRLETQVGRAEAQAAAAQDALQRNRKELEESKKKEMRLRDKLKDLLETDSGTDKVSLL
jgi:chromosome segregation ATPase